MATEMATEVAAQMATQMTSQAATDSASQVATDSASQMLAVLATGMTTGPSRLAAKLVTRNLPVQGLGVTAGLAGK